MGETTLKKKKEGYGYKYCDIAGIHEYLEKNNLEYRQYIETCELNGEDYVWTVPIVDGKEQAPVRGCRVVRATLSGKSNPAQEHGSALTYARRYSLLMAFGLATEDDDAKSLDGAKELKGSTRSAQAVTLDSVMSLLSKHGVPLDFVCQLYKIDDITNVEQRIIDNINSHMTDIVKKYKEKK